MIALVTLLKQRYPWSTSFYDLAHRYSLVVKASAQVIDQNFAKDLKKIINYFKNDAHKSRLAQISQKELGLLE